MTETSRSGPVAHDHRAMRPGGCSEAGKRSFPTVPEKSGGDEVVGGGLDAIEMHRLPGHTFHRLVRRDETVMWSRYNLLQMR